MAAGSAETLPKGAHSPMQVSVTRSRAVFDERGAQYTLYELTRIDGPSDQCSTIEKRFSDFKQLHTQLVERHRTHGGPSAPLPLPQGAMAQRWSLGGSGNMSPDFVKRRARSLQGWLNDTLRAQPDNEIVLHFLSSTSSGGRSRSASASGWGALTPALPACVATGGSSPCEPSSPRSEATPARASALGVGGALPALEWEVLWQAPEEEEVLWQAPVRTAPPVPSPMPPHQKQRLRDAPADSAASTEPASPAATAEPAEPAGGTSAVGAGGGGEAEHARGGDAKRTADDEAPSAPAERTQGEQTADELAGPSGEALAEPSAEAGVATQEGSAEAAGGDTPGAAGRVPAEALAEASAALRVETERSRALEEEVSRLRAQVADLETQLAEANEHRPQSRSTTPGIEEFFDAEDVD